MLTTHGNHSLARAKWGLVALLTLSVGVTSACSLREAARAGNGGAAPASALAMWVELGPSGVAIARVVTGETSCPSITIGAETRAMQVRAWPAAPDFPVLVCETIVRPATGSAVLQGEHLPLPKRDPRRIVVVGDTGCRLKPEVGFQACNDPWAWPFQRIARTAAAWKPDLVIHVGDYLYRQHGCPAGDVGCAGSPWGDSWATWNADFFAPAAELLRAAPWVVTRGNHEVCDRAGNGWFRFLDPHPATVGCQEYTSPYAVPAGELRLLMLDSSSAQDEAAPTAMVTAYAAQLAALGEAAAGNGWLITHHPVWGIGRPDDVKDQARLMRLNSTLQAASGNALAPSIRLVLSGHIHLFEVLSFTDGRPPQLIVGNSGTKLIPAVPSRLAGMELAGAAVADGLAIDRFGFMTMERSDTGWVATLRDSDGNPMARCLLASNRATCTR